MKLEKPILVTTNLIERARSKEWLARALILSLLFLVPGAAAVGQVDSNSTSSRGTPRAFLETPSGYLESEALNIDGKVHHVSNFLMQTYDIESFESLRSSDPSAWSSLANHSRYGVVGSRGILAGVALALIVAASSIGQHQTGISIALLLAGATYGMNSKHMAKHNLHEAMNKLNGVHISVAIPLK